MKSTDLMSMQNAIKSLRRSADAIMKIDGDRDHMNRSDLTCEQTQTGARLMREVAKFLEQLVE